MVTIETIMPVRAVPLTSAVLCRLGNLSPEGFASIMWKDAGRAPEAAEWMRVTAGDLKDLGIIEKIIPEPQPANPQNVGKIAGMMQEEIRRFLHMYLPMDGQQLAEQRYQRFRSM